MNDQSPYLSRRELRRLEAEAAARLSAAQVGVPTPSSPLVASTLPQEVSAPQVVVSGTPGEPAVARSTDPDTAVRASYMTRARMALAVNKQDKTDGRRPRRERPVKATRRSTHLATGKKIAPILAVLFVGGLALVTALPANANLNGTSSGINGEAFASSLAQDATTNTAVYDSGQQIEVSGAQAVSARDGVEATTLRTSFGGVHSSATYVNDPNGTIQWPFSVTVPISDMFGWRVPPCAWCSADHKGVDFDAGEGYPIQSVADGVVTKVHDADDNGDGMYVEITHNVNGLQFMSRYCHLLPGAILVSEGQTVKVGQIIAQVGNTGASTGAHLHFEIHVNGVAIDPYAWLMEHAN